MISGCILLAASVQSDPKYSVAIFALLKIPLQLKFAPRRESFASYFVWADPWVAGAVDENYAKRRCAQFYGAKPGVVMRLSLAISSQEGRDRAVLRLPKPAFPSLLSLLRT